MRKLQFLFVLSLISLQTFATQPPFKSMPDMPLPVQMLQWDLMASDELLIVNYINPLEADLYFKVTGPQGYVIHVQDLSDVKRSNIGFHFKDLAAGEYTVPLESGDIILDSKKIVLE